MIAAMSARMTSNKSKSNLATKVPPIFPALTQEQREWVVARRSELQAAVKEGIESGTKSGYRDFDADRLLSFIARGRQKVPAGKKKRA